MKTLFLAIFFLAIGCKDSKKDSFSKGSNMLNSPITIEEMHDLISLGITKSELYRRCGTPSFEFKTNNVEYIEYNTSFGKRKDIRPNEWMIISFVVAVSNNYVVSCESSGVMR